jgi:predicted TIM-barrel fold metal-dependent hydrolase
MVTKAVIIDIHAHPGYGRDLATLREEFPPAVRAAERCGVRWICLNAIADWSESPRPKAVREGNDAVLHFMAEYPDRVLGFCYVNPRYPVQALKEIDRCVVGEGMAGIKLWVACKASDRRVDAIARRAAQLGVPILQHAWYVRRGGLKGESVPADVAAMAKRHPRTMIVMAHLTGAGERGLKDIAPYPNLHVDISGGEPEAGMVELAVKLLGAERVLFGTDTPIRSYGATLGKVLEADLTGGERELILFGNAKRLLRRRLGR